LKALNESKIALIGLGYVGLPLAVEFSKKYPTVGFDINKNRIQELREAVDRTLEVANEELKAVTVVMLLLILVNAIFILLQFQPQPMLIIGQY
jgi:UDP-N-acetyl-D-mannosaminuronate dehydrogenase